MSYSKFAAVLLVFLLWIIAGACLFCQGPMIKKEIKTTSLKHSYHQHTEIQMDSWMPYHFDDSQKSPVY